MDFPERRYSIIAPPRSVFWMKFGNSISGLSLFFSFLFWGIAYRFYSPGSSLLYWRDGSWGEFTQYPLHGKIVLLGLFLGTLFLLIPFCIWLFRILRPSAKRFREIGSLFVGRDFFRLAYLDQSEEFVLPFAQVQRLDAFLSAGVSPSLFSKKDAFETNRTIRLAILEKGQPIYHLHLKNRESGVEEESSVGALYQEICEIKRKHAGMYQRIQFWHQF